MSWGYLTQLLEEVHRHSTFLSKLWITTFLIFRIVLTTVAGESIYYDEQGRFSCNTLQPGCENVCYDSFAPLSHVRFWVFHIIAVATPTVLYLGFAVHRITRIEYKRDEQAKRAGGPDRVVECTEKEEEVEEVEEEELVVEEVEEEVEEVEEVEEEGEEDDKGKQHNERWRIKTDGLMVAYTLQLLARTLAEVGFLVGQYLMYGFEVAPRFQCVRHPCPHRVDCFVSRPTEKTIFLLVMYAVAGLSLVLDLSEIAYLGLGAFLDSLGGRRRPRSRSAVGKHAADTTVEASRMKAAAHGSRHDGHGAPLAPPGYHSVVEASSDGNRTGLADAGEPESTAGPRAMSPSELWQLRDEVQKLETELGVMTRPHREPPEQAAGDVSRKCWV